MAEGKREGEFRAEEWEWELEQCAIFRSEKFRSKQIYNFEDFGKYAN